MSRVRLALGLCLAAALALPGCGTFQRDPDREPVPTPSEEELRDSVVYGEDGPPSSTIWDIFAAREDPGRVGSVNKYIWTAALETLEFLPVQTVDPFTGVLVTGYGTPPGGRTAYRATVLVDDPALDARSLNLALQTRSGPVSEGTVRAVEDAILTRARQLRLEDSRF